jgi:oxidase EvaA
LNIQRSQTIEDWFDQIIEKSSFKVEKIPLSHSREWILEDGAIRHKTGRFFNVVGVEWSDHEGNFTAQPLLEQKEIGILGFLIRNIGKAGELLAYGKIEPGNVGIVQIAPTYQATFSNSSLFHGGTRPPYFDVFHSERMEVIHDSLQSEQGTRFLEKFNRNVLATSHEEVLAHNTHRWMPVDEVLEFVGIDYLANTDTRSVLICSPWEILVSRKPFSRWDTPFSRDLQNSAEAVGESVLISELKQSIHSIRSKIKPGKIIPLMELCDWKITDFGLEPITSGPFVVRQIRVTARGREVSVWDQPIIDSLGDGCADLICGRIKGILHFLFQPQVEMGLKNRVELGPSFLIEPGDNALDSTLHEYQEAQIISQTRLSDEGGRFLWDRSKYRLLDAGEIDPSGTSGYWITLQQIRQLLNESGWFTNEARSALAQLLVWL